MHTHYFGATVLLDKFNRDLHFATKCGIFRFEFVDFHDTSVRHKLDKPSMVCVSVRSCFADAEKAGFKLKAFKKVMKLDSTEAIMSAVEARLGVGFVSRWAEYLDKFDPVNETFTHYCIDTEDAQGENRS